MSKLSIQIEEAAPTPARLRPPRHAMRPEGGSVHASVAGEIGQRIVRGDYPPGSILPNEAKWAETFKVSRSAVREAVKMLTAKSLLASRPKVGSRVEPRERWNLLDRDVFNWYATGPDRILFLRRVQEFRRLVEPEAAALAATKRDTVELAAITRFGREMIQATSREAWLEADVRFHLAIISAAGNELLLPLGVIVEAGLRHLFHFLAPSDAVLRELTLMHTAIERAIRLQRPDAAGRAVRQLLAYTDAIVASRLED